MMCQTLSQTLAWMTMGLKAPVEHAPQGTDMRSMPGLEAKAEADHPISKVIDDIARYAVASLFYLGPGKHRDVT
jgi:hypothetical protein